MPAMRRAPLSLPANLRNSWRPFVQIKLDLCGFFELQPDVFLGINRFQ
jgi:hypothetical protein